MQAAFELRYLKRREINTAAWDACIARSPQGLVYAHCFYLDSMADNWDALIVGNYEVVMPLPWKKRWGIRYVYQLPFVQRLGIFGKNITNGLVAKLYAEAARYFAFVDYKTNYANATSNTVMRSCNNFLIDLSQPYSDIKAGFSQECLKSIRKAEKRGCRLIESCTVETVITFFREAYDHYYSHYNSDTYQKLTALITKACADGFCKTYAVVNEEGAIVFASAIFQDERRIYYCIGAPNEEGRSRRATYFFINEMLRQHAEKNLTFDFEGSEIPNVAAFYSRFGPQTETYFEVMLSRFSFLLKWLKKK